LRAGGRAPRDKGGGKGPRRGGRTGRAAERGGGGKNRDARREGKRGWRGRERDKEERGAHLGIQKPVITFTGSPRARGGRERWKKGRGSCCAGKSNEREIEMWRMGGDGHRGRAGHAGLGRVGSGRTRSCRGSKTHHTPDH
jgi:hypothetical protein